jgi:hypothetical protein
VNESANEFNFCEHTAYYEYGPVFYTTQNLTPIGDVAESRKTITVPDSVSLPVTVFFCGSADDGFAVNGNRISRFAEIPSSLQMPSRTFTLSIWNDGGPIGGKVRMCFIQANPLP